jgi:hypothetical protein
MMSIESILETSENSLLFNVFQRPMLSKEQCAELTQKVLDHRYTHKHEGSMQKHTVDISSFLGEFLQETLQTLIPSINDLFYFGEENLYSLVTAHAILYSATGEGEKSLNTHIDDSDITLNLTIQSENLSGSELYFLDSTEYGNTLCNEQFGKIKQTLDTRIHVNSLRTELGTCILHRGNHPHSTSTIHSGNRIALILWLKKKEPCE